MEKTEQKYAFTIENDNYEKMMAFKEKHEQCKMKFPNVVGAQYTYSFIPNSCGEVIVIECACGEKLYLDDSFDSMGMDFSDDCISVESENTAKIIEYILSVIKRPKLFLENKPYVELNLFLNGMVVCDRINGSTKSNEKLFEAIRRINLKIENEHMTDEEKFDLFSKLFEEYVCEKI